MYFDLIIIAILLAAVSGLPGVFAKRTASWGQHLATLLMATGSISGLIGAWTVLLNPRLDVQAVFHWPAIGNSLIGIDALSAFFLIPIFLMGGSGSIYSAGYWPQVHHPGNGRKMRLFWGLLTAGMSLLVISRHAMAFLFGWEMMALSAFFLVSTEDYRQESRQAGWIYLIATHIGTLTLFALFTVWRRATGSYALQPVAADTISLSVLNGLFLLALLGFGLKAGIMPLHFWLPGAHAAAPSHVSAMLSGIVLKMGIYGLVRFLSLLPNPPVVWGGLILALGAVSGLLGVVFAIGQHDLKRLLAYHSVENIGIILMGLGLAMLGRSYDRPEWIVLGLAGCLLHVWNHSLFKSLLFLCAGSVVHHTHTRQIDRLGGLAKSMPWTAAMFIIGAIAICGLPPLNGFVSEFFIYLGLFRTTIMDETVGSAVMIVVPILAMIGALAVACFVKVYGAVFLGAPRTHAALHAHEAPLTMRIPMLIIAACCALIGLAPAFISPLLDGVITLCNFAPASVSPRLDTIVPLPMLSIMAASLLAGIAGWIILFKLRYRSSSPAGTWDCGYARPTSRMQYTASSFAQMIVTLFSWVLRPHLHLPLIKGLFSRPAEMHSHVDDLTLDRTILPAGLAIERWFGWFRRFQQGLIQHYLLYILITVILMLGMLVPFDKFIAQLLAR